MAQFTEQIFVDADLTPAFEYTYVHNLGTTNIILAWFDDNNIDRTDVDTFQIIDINTVKLYTGGPVTGSNRITGVYDNSVNITGRKLFGFTPVSSVDSNYKIALGDDGSPTRNMIISDFSAIVSNNVKDDFFLKTNLFNEVTSSDWTTVHTNLNVISKSIAATKTELDTATQIASLNLQGAKSFPNPSLNTDIASKLYVDTTVNAAKLLISGGMDWSGVAHSELTNRSFINVWVWDAGAQNKLINGQLSFTSSSTSTEFKYLGKLSKFTNSGTYNVRAFKTNTNQWQDAMVQIRANGEVYVHAGQAGNFICNVCVVQ